MTGSHLETLSPARRLINTARTVIELIVAILFVVAVGLEGADGPQGSFHVPHPLVL